MLTAASAALARSEEPPMQDDETDAGPVGTPHVPVMEGQVVEGLCPRPGARLVDATVGAGGHAAALLAAAPETTLLGLDRDPVALDVARRRLAPFGDRVRLRRASFATLSEEVAAEGWPTVDAVLLDLGVSSLQLDDPSRGFSFRARGPLDMRMGPDAGRTADEIVNTWPEGDLADLIARLGEEPRARRIARAIVRQRPIGNTEELATLVASAAAASRRPGHHPATRTFQAIRMAVNDEVAQLEAVLADGWALLAPGGRFGVLAFHSLEDRRVKAAFRRWAASCLCPPGLPECRCGWTRRVRLVRGRALRPDEGETGRNRRARSARWRVVERVPEAS
jgi:16S rRNA (cytosine1402-N4)-methyltransferase